MGVFYFILLSLVGHLYTGTTKRGIIIALISLLPLYFRDTIFGLISLILILLYSVAEIYIAFPSRKK